MRCVSNRRGSPTRHSRAAALRIRHDAPVRQSCGPSSHDADVEHRRSHRREDLNPDREEHLGSPSAGNVAQVDHMAPAEPVLQYGRYFRLGAGVVAADENVMVSTGDLLRD